MKHIFSTLLKIVGLVILLLVLLVVFLQTTPGKSVLASYLSKELSGPAPGEVRIEGISGLLPVHMHFDRIAFGDAQGEWLVMKDAQLRLVVSHLLKGEVRVTGLKVEEVALIRRPRKDGSAQRRKEGGKRTGNMVVHIEECSVERFKLEVGVAGVPLEYSLHSDGMTLASGIFQGAADITGDADGHVDFELTPTKDAGKQLALQARLDEWRKPLWGMDRLSGTAKATMDARGVQANVEVDLEKDGKHGHLVTPLSYSDRRLEFKAYRFDGEGWASGGDLSLAFPSGAVDVEVDASLKDPMQRVYSMQTLTHVLTTNKTWAVNMQYMTVKAWNAVTINLSGSFDREQANLEADLAEFDLDALPFRAVDNFLGRVRGSCRIFGKTASPQVVAGLDVVRFTTSAKALDEFPKMDFHVDAGITNGQLFASTSVTNFISGYFAGSGRMPCAFSVLPFRFAPNVAGLSGSLDGVLDLGVFNGLAMLDNQHVDGFLTTELEYENGAAKGFMQVEKGAYEHYGWGVLFRDFNARLDATTNGFVISQGEASDGGDGRIRLSGGIQNGMMDVQLKLSGAKVVRRPEVEGSVSGTIHITEHPSHPSITGELVVDRADFLPDNIVSAQPAVLESFDAESEVENEETVAKERRPFPVQLDIKVDMPDQIYVNASLIDSVWGGDLRLRDSAKGLSIKGKFEPRRGHVDFVGKPFRLIDGSIELDGSVPPMPVMNNLTAEYSRSDISARLVLNGNVASPLCRLESTPPLPEDEILSHVLFKRDASTISPYQAIQIAAAAQQLSSGLSGPGFMYQFRRAVGIDTLDVRETDDTSPEAGQTVAAGKYITPELYVEVNRSFGGAESQTGMTAEYEINRHFSVETTTGQSLRPGIGLNWKYDY